jgi:hypothetical protein
VKVTALKKERLVRSAIWHFAEILQIHHLADGRVSANLPAGISEPAWKNPVNGHDYKNDPERDNHLFDSHIKSIMQKINQTRMSSGPGAVRKSVLIRANLNITKKPSAPSLNRQIRTTSKAVTKNV